VVALHAPRRALVLGVNGQDGSYLAEHLLVQGWMVAGVGRQATSRWVSLAPGFQYVPLDLADSARFAALLQEFRPDAIFHFAAVHGSAGFSYEEHWHDVHLVNTVATHAALEYLRVVAPEAVLVYASSSKVFGEPLPLHITEASPRASTCIYTTTKNASTDLIRYYRSRHGLRASVVWTFNHESPRRGGSYFLPRIIDTLARAILDPHATGQIGALGFWSDWGDAQEFMAMVAAIAEQAPGTDLLLATGQTWWAMDFVDTLFQSHGLRWRDHLIVASDAPAQRPPRWAADVSGLQRVIGRSITRSVFDVAQDILQVRHPQAWARVAPRSGDGRSWQPARTSE